MQKKVSTRKERRWRIIMAMMLMPIVLCTSSCKDDDSATDSFSQAFDPSKPVVISDFTPKEGSAYQKMVIYGENFGNDSSIVKVTVGEKEATLVTVESNNIYCFVPSGAFSGEVTVSVGSGDNVKTSTAADIFDYQREMVVSTVAGYKNDYDSQGWVDGPFETMSGFRLNSFLKADPRYPHLIYCAYDGGDIQLIDIEKREVSTPISRSIFGSRRLRSVDFTLDGEYMIVGTDAGDLGVGETPSVYVLKRNTDGTFTNESNPQIVASYYQCNGAVIHPVNGELYFNSYQRGQFFRVEISEYFEAIDRGESWDPTLTGGNYMELFTIQDVSWEFNIHIHPTGNYAYICVINKHYILRTDYNHTEKRFTSPYILAGQVGVSSWADGIGTDVCFGTPYQGVFVKNPEYVAEGKADEYDFYLTDNANYCIRKLTPEGIVSTYAGRGTSGVASDGNLYGTDDGNLREAARFNKVTGIAYDEESETFYIIDNGGRTLRTISEEQEDDTSTNTEEDTEDESDE